MRLEIVISDAPILDRHVLRQEACSVTLWQMPARHGGGWHEAPGLGIPMHPASSDTVRRHERTPGTDWKRGLIHLVAKGEGGLLGPQKQLMANPIPQLVGHITRRIIRRGVAPGGTLDRDDVETGIGELVSENRTGPAEADDDDILRRQFARHSFSSRLTWSPISAPGDTDGRMWIAFVMAMNPVAIA